MGTHIICARPGHGRYKYIADMTNKFAKEGKKVLFIAIELSRKELIERFKLESENISILETVIVISESIEKTLKKYPSDILVIDSFDLILTKELENIRSIQDYETVNKELMDIAQKLNMEIYITKLLNRKVEAREDKRPVLEDVKIHEKYATSLIGLYRDEVYNRDSDKHDIIEIIDLKTGISKESHFSFSER